MVPMPASLIGYRISCEAIEDYRSLELLPENYRPSTGFRRCRAMIPLAAGLAGAMYYALQT
jgi:hypothetical protein